MSHLSDLKRSGHWPSLLAAFLHFDVSFTVWVILGALAPFIALDAAVTGANLHITSTSAVVQGRYAIVITGPSAAQHEASGTYHLAIKTAVTAANAAAKPLETYTLNNAQPATLAALNARSRYIRIALATADAAAPRQQTVALISPRKLEAQGQNYQTIATGLSAGMKGIIIAVPLLAAAFFRLLLGLLSDRFGSKRIGTISMALTLVPLLIGWQLASTIPMILCMGVFLGVAGASFAVALPLASRWYPPHLQGLALGIAGAGNSGTVMATLFAPLLAGALGWHAVLGLLMIPVLVVLTVFVLLARDAPGAPRPHPLASYRLLLTRRDTYTFCLLYFVTFGGFLGLSSFLNTFFVDQFHVARATVGIATVPFVLIGSLLRPVGGALADRVGGTRMLTIVYGIVAAAMLGIGAVLSGQIVVSAFLLLAMGCLGMGNGAVFQLIPQRFQGEIGAITGLVGAVGGVGGFYLNILLGSLKDASGSYALGFWVFAATAAAALAIMRLASAGWTWQHAAARLRDLQWESPARAVPISVDGSIARVNEG